MSSSTSADRLKFVVLFLCCLALTGSIPVPAAGRTRVPQRRIVTFGGDIQPKMVRYVASLTGKAKPKIWYVPTASADNPDNIRYWNSICAQLPIEAHVLRVWVSSDPAARSFHDQLLGADAIIVGGGNTLNMLGIWKVQGIDEVLREAWKRGILLAGGSAGSICWFDVGASDARPVCLSLVEGLGLLPYSHCPHYGDSLRRVFYHRQLLLGRAGAGYACDDGAAILFHDEQPVEAVSINRRNRAYFVHRSGRKIEAVPLECRQLVNEDAVPEGSYARKEIGRRVCDFPRSEARNEPLEAFLSIKYLFAEGRNSAFPAACCAKMRERVGEMADQAVDTARKHRLMQTLIARVLVYEDKLAGVVSELGENFYGLWFFYRENGEWLSAGEDVGGETADEAEITFREKVPQHLLNF